jgi:hypothetical protein
MKIPKEDVERERFIEEIISKCLFSREERARDYASYRGYFLHGAGPDEAETPYNKIYPTVDLLTSFLFSSETTNFTIHVGPEVHEDEWKKIPPLSKAINTEWLNSGADMVFMQGLTWALVYNTVMIKLVMRGKDIHPFVVEPHMFGVFREDMSFTDRQEAMVHCYYTTRSQLRNDLINHPNIEKILASIQPEKKDLSTENTGLDRIILVNSMPNIQGNVDLNFGARYQMAPQVDEELVEMQELWIWDDEINDYRVITRADNRVTIYDRKNFFVDGENPFVQICPNPMYGYYWGMSEVFGLVGLQKWRNERVAQMRKLLDKQVSPPKVYTGSGIQDEKLYGFGMAGSYLSVNDPMGKFQELPPTMPSDIFSELSQIDEMFAERSGLQNLLQGKGESGVRSGRQTSELARLGSARIKKRALIIEDALEKMATLYLKAKRVYDDRKYKDEDGVTFIANQFPDDSVVKVDGHSNSPLFVEDQKAIAAELLKAKAIDRESYLEMVDPPMKEVLLRRLKNMEEKEAAASKAKAQQELQMEQAKHSGAAGLKQVK